MQTQFHTWPTKRTSICVGALFLRYRVRVDTLFGISYHKSTGHLFDSVSSSAQYQAGGRQDIYT